MRRPKSTDVRIWYIDKTWLNTDPATLVHCIKNHEESEIVKQSKKLITNKRLGELYIFFPTAKMLITTSTMHETTTSTEGSARKTTKTSLGQLSLSL
jgi:hypothetical protein